MYLIKYYITARGESPVQVFIDSLSQKPKEKVVRAIHLLEELGPNLPRPYADMVRGKIRELRIQFGRIEIRILYSFFMKEYILFSHAFMKKTREVPEPDISLAERRREDFISRLEKGEIRL